ncbi:MAG: pirin family protein [Candidatus Omnitrophica bacterium]|nr:pirin family protein [Candidatus Omnitrophota bacterium]
MKKIILIHQSPQMHWVGNGFPVRSVFDYNGLGRELNPFILLDYAAPYQFSPGNERRGVDTHPHKGFETVTIAYQGEIEHRDSSGGGGIIRPGDAQWMTAGKGILHQEFHSSAFVRQGGTFQMVQLWINLPAKNKNAQAKYQNLRKAAIPVVSFNNNRGTLRVISGEYAGKKGPAQTFTPINLWDVNLNAEQSIELPVPDGHHTAVLVLSGKILSDDKKKAGEGDLMIYDRSGESIKIYTETACRILLMDGRPLDEPLVGYGPFVMNTDEEIKEAFQAYKNGSMGKIN